MEVLVRQCHHPFLVNGPRAELMEAHQASSQDVLREAAGAALGFSFFGFLTSLF